MRQQKGVVKAVVAGLLGSVCVAIAGLKRIRGGSGVVGVLNIFLVSPPFLRDFPKSQ